MAARLARVHLDGVEYVVLEWRPHGPPSSSSSLTAAERAVAALVARGQSNAAIARARGTSERTVANQIGSILRKLGVSSRAHIAAVLETT